MKTLFKKAVYGVVALVVLAVMIKISGWSPLNLFFGPQHENKKVSEAPSIAHLQELWWLSEYPELIKAINVSPSKQLSTSFRTGSDGLSVVHLNLSQKGNGIILDIKLPKQALVSHDKKNNAIIPSSEPPKIIMRDQDQDGVLDNFLMVPGTPSPGTSVTTDGYIKFEPKEEYQGIFIQWVVCIGYSINHFLHGIDSAYPRK
jgi:hypothetical protein